MRKRDTTARDAEIARRVAAREPQGTIAADFGLTGVRVSQIAKAAGIVVGRGANKDNRGSRNPRWKAKRHTAGDGYIVTVDPDVGGRKYEHIRVAEAALGKPLPHSARVHHVDGNRAENRSRNLVICQDQGYHLLLHQRQRALEACGNPSWRKCKFCKQYDALENLRDPNKKGESPYHRACATAYDAARRAKKGA